MNWTKRKTAAAVLAAAALLGGAAAVSGAHVGGAPARVSTMYHGGNGG